MEYRIKYGLNGGFGGIKHSAWTHIVADSFAEAEEYAYQCACEKYESYVGMRGLPDIWEIENELGEGVSEDELMAAYNEARDSWICYVAEEVTT